MSIRPHRSRHAHAALNIERQQTRTNDPAADGKMTHRDRQTETPGTCAAWIDEQNTISFADVWTVRVARNDGIELRVRWLPVLEVRLDHLDAREACQLAPLSMLNSVKTSKKLLM